MKNRFSLWGIFASLPLALCTMAALAASAIVGTIIPQNLPGDQYVASYGQGSSLLIRFMQLDDMYGSWWFLGLWGLLTANILVCSLERLPRVLKVLGRDNLAVSARELERRHLRQSWQVGLAPAATVVCLARHLKGRGWPCQIRESGQGTLLFSQRGGWSRLAVYLVHLAVVIIIIGGVVGRLWGLQANLELVESQGVDSLVSPAGNKRLPLGFTLRCDGFSLDHHGDGSVKDYQALLTVLDGDKELLNQRVAVNHPLHFRGLTIYLSDYDSFHEFILRLQSQGRGQKKEILILPYQQTVEWRDLLLEVSQVRLAGREPVVRAMQIRWQEGGGATREQWFTVNQPVALAGGQYSLAASQLHGVNLQVRRDPGLPLVYLGFVLLLAGLSVGLTVSHRRIWLLVTAEGEKSVVTLAAASNKKSPARGAPFAALAAHCRECCGVSE
ncbi:MAG: cytochrome c biogenesis protein ResB [Thermodesulfobacteriota bacterium]